MSAVHWLHLSKGDYDFLVLVTALHRSGGGARAQLIASPTEVMDRGVLTTFEGKLSSPYTRSLRFTMPRAGWLKITAEHDPETVFEWSVDVKPVRSPPPPVYGDLPLDPTTLQGAASLAAEAKRAFLGAKAKFKAADLAFREAKAWVEEAGRTYDSANAHLLRVAGAELEPGERGP